MQASELVLLQTSNHVEDDVRDFLRPVPQALEDLKRNLRLHTLNLDQLEPYFYQTLHAHARLSELTFTSPRGQLSVFRQPDGRIVTRHINAKFQARQRSRGPDQPYSDNVAWKKLGKVPDPTEHPTYTTPFSFYRDGDLSPLWSDLSYSQIDRALPIEKRRIGVTVQAAIADRQFLGVARIGLVTAQLMHAFDDIGKPYSAFLCDSKGRLITPVMPTQDPDPIQEDDDDLRVVPKHLDPNIKAILSKIPTDSTLLHEKEFLACVRPLKLENSQDWWVGLVVPESALVGDLPNLRRQLLEAAIGAGALITLLVTALLYLLRRELKSMQATTRLMKDFNFEAQPVTNLIQDTAEVAQSLEAAKTTLRAMVKYVPVELVRQLFEARLEPVLSSSPQTVVLMFSDIAGFTTMAEKLTPADLARSLGSYLTTMNEVIHKHHGTVLERVGDALLSLWNAPTPVENGEQLACRSALLCQQAIDTLPDAAILQTRFGIHRDTVLVGHFGSPDRLNYGVLGDGVNLASRLEGLNKQYGTQIIVSQSIQQQLGPEFHLRRLDLVAVKGKNQGIQIYELLTQPSPYTEPYEKAWYLYAQRQFSSAIELLQSQQDQDPPSARLAARCRTYLVDPPEEDWNGTHRAQDK